MNKKKIIELLVELNRLTVCGDLKWYLSTPPQAISVYRDVYVPRYYFTEYKGKNIAVYEERVRRFSGEYEEHYHVEYVCFAILSDKNQLEFVYAEEQRALMDLFETIVETSVDIDGLLDNLLD
ncbi:MAG: hypothetical protein K4305_06885 [Chlorobium sp.]|uniref:hypothetical protein n=1 Tax=Chlorobium sp. TaxID=1095 RepID=UPI002F40E7E1